MKCLNKLSSCRLSVFEDKQIKKKFRIVLFEGVAMLMFKLS
jgi:hypothetical protein